MSDPALQLQGIHKGYNHGTAKEVLALRGVDLAVHPGEVVAMVAPSGAGKSTLLHIAGLLDTADEGRVYLGGEDMTALGDRRRTRVANEVEAQVDARHRRVGAQRVRKRRRTRVANGVAGQVDAPHRRLRT